ncbi:MAG TPA: GNAT family N-acetyltransferase [Cellvibrionaceae bacterium]|nr:GNAT family N-acetyltransferase [Cellvibrionaceae bacterium]
MNLRPATNADIPFIKAIVFDVLREHGLQPDSASTDKDLEDIEAIYFAQQGFFAVLEDAGHIVATFGLMPVDEQTCELRKMYMLPSQRGRGLGKYLMESALDKACQLGFKRIVLETASPLRTAIALYKKYGFKEYRPAHMSARCDQAFELCLGNS